MADEWWRDLPAQSQRRARRLRAYNWILYTGWFAAALYTVLLTLLDCSPKYASLRDAWIAETGPIARTLCHLVWAIGQLHGELTRRGFPGRAALASNVVAFQWLIIGLTAIVTLALNGRETQDRAIRDALRKRGEAVRRSFRAASCARKGGAGDEPIPTAIWVMMAVVMLIWPWFCGASAASSRDLSYDLAFSDAGLFIPFLLNASLWGCGIYLFGLIALNQARARRDRAKA
jgi:hypothetical protein